MQFISASDESLRTQGRITATADGGQLWVYPYTQAHFRFTGRTLAVRLRNHWNYGDIRLGVIIDNTQYSVRIPSPAEPDMPANCAEDPETGMLTLTIADHLPTIEHEAVVFKRQDGGMHYLEFAGVLVDGDARVSAPAQAPSERRIEIYGDSVSCGERNEAVLYTGKADPDVDLSGYSNSWYSYGAVAARKLGADLRIIAQGGAPLLDGIGWFNAPDYIGMESIRNRTQRADHVGFPRLRPARRRHRARAERFAPRGLHGTRLYRRDRGALARAVRRLHPRPARAIPRRAHRVHHDGA